VGEGRNQSAATQRRDLRIAIIGAGMSGILSAIQLVEAGLDELVIYEKADRLGGTWRENTYPGVACDVPSHLYCYSFEPNPDWSQRFAPGSEIQAYFENVARKYDVEKFIRFGEELVSCDFHRGRWHIETANGTRDTADIVIAATGVLHHPRYPEIEGLDSFAGETFHSARWNHGIALEGKRIGVIGTGSTAVQITSAVIDRVAEFSLFQRTPQWIMPQENPPYSEQERAEFRADPSSMQRLHADISRLFSAGFSNAVVDSESPQMHMIEAMCLANLENSVADPELRNRLRPEYRAACKRLVVSEDFYQAIQKPNAELVTDPIEGVERDGIRTSDGRLHPLDVIVMATGFQVDRFMRPIAITGRDGRSLDDAWKERPVAYLAISIPEFPNLFMLNGPNGPVGNFSLIEVAELQFRYIQQLIDLVRSGRCREVCATRAATDRFDSERTEASKKTVWVTGCNSWYLDDRGIPATWPWTFDRFREEMAAPQIEAFELRR